MYFSCFSARLNGLAAWVKVKFRSEERPSLVPRWMKLSKPNCGEILLVTGSTAVHCLMPSYDWGVTVRNQLASTSHFAAAATAAIAAAAAVVAAAVAAARKGLCEDRSI